MLPPKQKKIAASKKEDPNACVTAGITNDRIQIYGFKKLWINFNKLHVGNQGAKKIIFTACHSGKLKLAFTSPDVISTSPKNFLTSRIDFTVLLFIEFLKKHHLPVGQVKNRIH